MNSNSSAPRRRGKRGKRGARQRARQLALGIPKPEQFTPTYVVRNHVMRYNCTTTNSIMSTDFLLNSWVVASTSSAYARLVNAIKLKRVRIWGPAPSAGSSPNTISVEFIGSGVADTTLGPSQKFSDSTMGAQMAYLDVKPPRGSIASWWLEDGISTQTVANLVTYQGCVVDLIVDISFKDDEAVSTATGLTSGASATVGRPYAPGLGNTIVSGGNPRVGFVQCPT